MRRWIEPLHIVKIIYTIILKDRWHAANYLLIISGGNVFYSEECSMIKAWKDCILKRFDFWDWGTIFRFSMDWVQKCVTAQFFVNIVCILCNFDEKNLRNFVCKWPDIAVLPKFRKLRVLLRVGLRQNYMNGMFSNLKGMELVLVVNSEWIL